MPLTRLEYLYERCINEEASREEQQEMISLMQLPENKEITKELLHNAYLREKNLLDIPEDISTSILEAIFYSKDEIKVNTTSTPDKALKPIRWIKSLAAAAVIFILTGTAIKFMNLKRKNSNPVVVHPEILQLDSVNTSTRMIAIVLPDSSLVKLMPGSKISYASIFPDDKRIVSLMGEAEFKVAQNPLKPFSVYSDGVSTTALGTRFKVTAGKLSKSIKVILYEGEVVVRPTPGSNKMKLFKDFFLVPGDEFYFDKQTYFAAIKKTPHYHITPWVNTNPKEIVRSSDDNNYYIFKTENLSKVFDELALIYNVKINYNAKDIANINFIGQASKKDALITILDDIAKLNNLSVTKKGEIYFIKRNSPDGF